MNRPDPTQYRPIDDPEGRKMWAWVGLIAFAAVMAMAGLVCLAGCHGSHAGVPAMVPVTPNTAPATNALAHLASASRAIEAARPETTPAGRVILETAGEHVEAAKPQIWESKGEIERLTRELNAVNDRLADEQNGRAEDRADAELALKRERDRVAEWQTKWNAAWLGGRAWMWIRGITATLVITIILGLILNAKTDVFVYLAGPVHWAFDLVLSVFVGAFKLVGQLFSYAGKSEVRMRGVGREPG